MAQIKIRELSPRELDSLRFEVITDTKTTLKQVFDHLKEHLRNRGTWPESISVVEERIGLLWWKKIIWSCTVKYLHELKNTL